MSNEGTSFEIDLPVIGAQKVDAAAASVDTLAASLGGSTKAVQATEASYAKAEAAADRAAKALERVGLAADVEKAKLAAASKVGDQDAVERLTAKMRDLSAEQAVLADRANKAKAALESEAKALDKAPKPAQAAKPATDDGGSKGEGLNLEAVTRGLNKIGGPLAATGGKLAELGGGFEKLSSAMAGGPYLATAAVVLALVAAFVSLVASVVENTIKLGIWAVGLADANRNASLLAQGLTQSVVGGTALNDKLTQLTKTLPLTREELDSTAQRLTQAGLRGDALTAALEKSATAAAELKFGPDFANEMLSLDEQSKVFHANLASIFGGLKIDGLLTALQKFLSIFDTANASGKAVKVVFESVFQPLIDGVTAAEPKIERFFLQLEVLALKAAIFLKPHVTLIEDIGKAFLIVAAVIGGVVLVALGAIAAAIAIPIALFAALIFAANKAGEAIVSAFASVKAWLANFDLSAMGKAMIDGLIAGIENGGAALLSAVKGAVNGAVDAAKKALGIASPSKVFAEIGMQTGAGMAVGVDKSSDQVHGSMASIMTPPAPSGASPAPAAASAKSGGNTFVFNLSGGAEALLEQVKEIVTRIVEGDAAQLGAVAPQS